MINHKIKNLEYVDEFVKMLGDSHLFMFRGRFSPSIMWANWSVPPGTLPYHYSTPLPSLTWTKNEDTVMLFSQDNYEEFSIRVFTGYWNGKLSIEQIKKDLEIDFYGLINELYDLYTREYISSLSDEDLISFFIKIKPMLTEFAAKSIFVEQFDERMALSVIGNDKKDWLNEIWEFAASSPFKSFELRRNEKILLEIKKGAEEALDKLTFIYTDYWKPKEDDEILNILKTINIKELEQEVNSDLNKLEKRLNEFNKLENALDKDEKSFVDYVHFIMESRDIRKDPLAKLQFLMYTVLEELAKRANIDKELVLYMTFEDLPNSIEEISKNKEEYENRKNNGVYSFSNVIEPIKVSSDNFEEFVKYAEDKIPGYRLDEKNNIINGTSASKGFVNGRVKIILNAHDSEHFEEGDILVTSMTRPEFVPLMKKSKAIITNEGGITCHAAIVSRELGIPCVIGTRNATQVLKDGDTVEVDADNGVIKTIK